MYCILKDEEGGDIDFLYLEQADMQVSGGMRIFSFLDQCIGLTSPQKVLGHL